MDTKQLKQKILDLAIRGKLVPQDPNDEPASVLLERIRKEKEQLIASGKLKKSKSKTTDTPHYENVPFEIPASWKWVRIKDIAISELGKTLDKGKNSGEFYDYLCALNVKWGAFDLATVKQILLEDKEKERYLVRKGDLLICEGGDVGRAAIWENEKEIYYQNALHRVRFKGGIDQYFYLYALQYYKHLGFIDDVSGGVTIKHFTQNSMQKLLFPLPPLQEQKRIAYSIVQWFALIDEIEANKKDLQEYIKQTKSKVLDLAIHGKLVPQDPNDEPATELLKRINPHFTSCDTSHYENLPSGWASVMLLDICKIDTGKWDANHASINGKYRFYTCSAQFSYSDTKRFSGECLIIPGNGDIGQVYYYDGDFDAYQRTYVLSHILIYSKYLYYHLLSNWRNVNTDKQFGSTIKFVRIGNFQNYIVLLPPLAEQKRIVERIETIFAQLDTITAEL